MASARNSANSANSADRLRRARGGDGEPTDRPCIQSRTRPARNSAIIANSADRSRTEKGTGGGPRGRASDSPVRSWGIMHLVPEPNSANCANRFRDAQFSGQTLLASRRATSVHPIAGLLWPIGGPPGLIARVTFPENRARAGIFPLTIAGRREYNEFKDCPTWEPDLLYRRSWEGPGYVYI
jgi:hypothetical protein